MTETKSSIEIEMQNEIENESEDDDKRIDELVRQNAEAKLEWKERLNLQAVENMRSKLKIALVDCIKPHWKLAWKRKIMETVQGISVALVSNTTSDGNNIVIIFPNPLKTTIINSLDKLHAHIFLSTVSSTSNALKICPELDHHNDGDDDDFFINFRKAIGHEIIPFNVWWDVARAILFDFANFKSRPVTMTQIRRQDNLVFVHPQHYNRELFATVNNGQFAEITLGSWQPVPWNNNQLAIYNWCKSGQLNYQRMLLNNPQLLLRQFYHNRIINLMFRHDFRKLDAALRFDSLRLEASHGLFLRSPKDARNWKSYDFKFSNRFLNNPEFAKIIGLVASTFSVTKSDAMLFDRVTREGLQLIPPTALLNLLPTKLVNYTENAVIPVTITNSNSTAAGDAIGDSTIFCERLDSYFTMDELLRLLEWLIFSDRDVAYGLYNLTEDFPTLADDFSDPDNIKGSLRNFVCRKQLDIYQSIIDELHATMASLTCTNRTTVATKISLNNVTATYPNNLYDSSPLRIPVALVDIIGHYLPFVPV